MGSSIVKLDCNRYCTYPVAAASQYVTVQRTNGQLFLQFRGSQFGLREFLLARIVGQEQLANVCHVCHAESISQVKTKIA